MDANLIATIGVGVAVMGFLWNIHRDMGGLHKDIAGLRERMARLEGLFEGFTGRPDSGEV